MLFSSNQENKEKEGKQKKRSVLGFLFNPGIETEIAPLRESASMFVRMIALIFAMNGLFPKNHPALNDQKIRLTLREVINTAWNGVSFTKQGLPQAVLFVAVTGVLGFSALFVIAFILSLFMGKAHAQGIFDTPATEDWAISWIDYLFKGQEITQTGGELRGCELQSAMSSVLGFFSGAVLILSGVILLYHLMSMIAKTAQTGKPFEGANQVWAPIRLVFAIALLVPLAGNGGGPCQITGYNAGQYLVMKIASWGSGLASNAWSRFLTSLNDGSQAACAANTSSPSCANTTKDVVSLLQPLIVYDACAKIANYHLDVLHQGNQGIRIYDIVNQSVPSIAVGEHGFGYVVFPTGGLSGVLYGAFGFGKEDAQSFCGGYNVPASPVDGFSTDQSNPYVDVYEDRMTLFGQYVEKIHDFNNTYYMMAIEGVNFYDYNAEIVEKKNDYKKLVEDFKRDLGTVTQSALDASQATINSRIQNGTANVNFSKYGWLSAGAWFNTIARMQANKFQVLSNSLPTPIRPKMLTYKEGSEDKGQLNGIQEITRTQTEAYARSMNAMGDFISQNEPASTFANDGKEMPSTDIMKSLMNSEYFVDRLIVWGDQIGRTKGLWSGDGTLAVTFGRGQNPIEEITAFGQKFISAGETILTIAGIAALAGVSLMGNNIGTLASFAATLLTTFAIVFLTVGFTLGFIVPLYPFYRFFFGSVQWIMTVFEAVVLMPLFALAHINPGGDGLSGPQAKYGYSVGMQLILRPVLMIFGLVAGYLLFKATLSFLNAMFVVASAGTGTFSGAHAALARLVYSVLYAALVVILANKCFKPIGLFPQVALAWLGMQKPHEENVGDAAALTAAAGYVSGQVLTKMLPQLTEGPSNVSKGIKENKIKKKDKEDAQAAALRDKAHKDMEAAQLGLHYDGKGNYVP